MVGNYRKKGTQKWMTVKRKCLGLNVESEKLCGKHSFAFDLHAVFKWP